MLAMADTNIGQFLPVFAELGISVAFLVPTPTGYEKSIMDATIPVRQLLREANIHDYDQQKQGELIMIIEKNINGTAAALKIIGRLDTTTAPELEATIDACAAGIQELVLDCSELEYVSSAGLRVILKAQKLMNAQGNMKLTHVNETIMEVFDITGFADILTIE